MGWKTGHETWARCAEAALEERARRIAELEGEVASASERLTALGIERAAVEDKLAAGFAETEVLKAELESSRGAAAAAQVSEPWPTPPRDGPCVSCVRRVPVTTRHRQPVGWT